MKTLRVPKQFALTILITLCIVALSAPAWAVEGLLDKLPNDHNTFVGADFDRLRGSPFFTPTIALVRGNPTLGASLRTMEEQLGLKVETDIQQVALVTNGPPISLSMLNDPMGAATAAGPRGATIIVRGRFESDQILRRLSGEEQAPAHLRLDGLEVHRLSENTLALITGPDSYRQGINRTILRPQGLSATFRAAISKVGTQGIYVVTAPDLEADVQAMGADARLAIIGVQAGSNVRLRMLLTMSDSETAVNSKKNFQGLREQAASNPMLGIFGVRPLVANMEISNDDNDVILNTSMTNNEARILIQRVVGYLQTTQDLQRPLGPTPGGDTSGGGVDADFN